MATAKHAILFGALALLLGSLALYARTVGFGFVNFDDPGLMRDDERRQGTDRRGGPQRE